MTTTTEQNADTNTEQQTDTELSHDDATDSEESTEQQETNEATPQELKQREIIASKQKLVNDGVIDHKDLATWLQERVTPKDKVSETESLKEELRREIQEDMEYEALKKTIPADTSKDKLEKMEDIMGDSRYKMMSKPERLEFAKFKAGLTSDKEVEKARQEGLEIGKFGLLGIGNYNANERSETKLSKTEAKYDSIPKFLKK